MYNRYITHIDSRFSRCYSRIRKYYTHPERTVFIMGEVKQTNFRIDQETADAFRKFCEENGWNQAEGFDNVMRQVELNKAKTATPGRAVEIESFEKSVKDIMAAYLNSIEINNNAEARIREQFATALDSKDKTISDLQKKMAELQDAKTTAEQTSASAAQAAAQAIKDEEAAREQADTATKLAAEKDKTILALTDKLTSAEEKAKGYDALTKAKADADAQITALQAQISADQKEHERVLSDEKKAAERALNDAHKDADVQLRELRAQMDRAVSDAKKDAALAQEKAIAEAVSAAQDEAQAKIQEIRDRMQDELRQTDKENAKLQAKIEALEARINELTTAK